MALIRKNTNEKSRQEWLQERKEIAKQQLLRIPILTEALFSKEDITGFLQLISRLPYYSFQNLLIIYDKCPEATVLAGFPIWQQMISSSEPNLRVLKPEAVRKGIDLIAPFTNITRDQNYELTWYSVLVFDIRQTNVRNFRERPEVYSFDHLHEMTLHDAALSVISSCFNRNVIFDPHTQELTACGLSGRITKDSVTVRRGLDEEKTLFWLIEALCELTVTGSELSLPSRNLLPQYIHFCLYRIWKLSHPGILPGSHSRVPKEEQQAFLDLLQRNVFELNQKIAGAYISSKKEDHDIDDILGSS